MGGQTYPLNAHYISFTRPSLRDHLIGVGFVEVRPWERGTDELTSLPDFTSLVALIGAGSTEVRYHYGSTPPTLTPGEQSFLLSLNLEAIK